MYRGNNNDWSCPGCGFSNFRRNRQCKRCGTPRGGGGNNNNNNNNRGNRGGNNNNKGDWICPSCHINNFASRQQCFKCRANRPGNTSNAASNAPNSDKTQLEEKKQDSPRGSRRGGFNGVNGGNEIKQEWKCLNCKNINWNDSLLCRVCNEININCRLKDSKYCFETQFINNNSGNVGGDNEQVETESKESINDIIMDDNESVTSVRSGASSKSVRSGKSNKSDSNNRRDRRGGRNDNKQSGRRGRKGNENDKEKQWTCTKCGTKNYPRREKCFKKNCDGVKPDPVDNVAVVEQKVDENVDIPMVSNNANDTIVPSTAPAAPAAPAAPTDPVDNGVKTIEFAKGNFVRVSDGGTIESLEMDLDSQKFSLKVSWNVGKLTGYGTAVFENETSAVLAQQILSQPQEYRVPEARGLPVFRFDFKSKFPNESYIDKDIKSEGNYKLKLKLPFHMQREDKLTDETLTKEISKILKYGIKEIRSETVVKCQFVEAWVFRYDNVDRNFNRFNQGNAGDTNQPNTKEYNETVLKSIFDKYNCKEMRVNEAKFGVCTAILSFDKIEDTMKVLKDFRNNNLLPVPPVKFSYSQKLRVQIDLRCVLEVGNNNHLIYAALKPEIDRLMYRIRRNKLSFGNTKVFLFQSEGRVVLCGNHHEGVTLASKLYNELIEPSIIQFDNNIIAFLVYNYYLKNEFKSMRCCAIEGPSSLNILGLNQNENNNNNKGGNSNEIRIYSTKEQREMIEECIKQFEKDNIECKKLQVTAQAIRGLASPKCARMLNELRRQNEVFIKCDIATKTIEMYHVVQNAPNSPSPVGTNEDDQDTKMAATNEDVTVVKQGLSKELVAASAVLEGIIKDIASTDSGVNKDDNDNGAMCGVCFMGFEPNEAFCTLSNCKHCVHKDCFEMQMQSCSQPTGSRPVKCAECAGLVALQDVSNVMNNNEASMKNLIKLCVNDYVAKHPNLYAHCPTPDCPAIYRKPQIEEKEEKSGNDNNNNNASNSASNQDEDKSDSKEEEEDKINIYSCQVCLRQYCLTCLKDGVPVGYHFGQTCKEYQVYINEDSSFAEFMKEYTKDKDTKNCPFCNTITDKFKNTCNHATCVYCKTHFCWKCLWFDKKNRNNGQVVYRHMTARHGGWYTR